MSHIYTGMQKYHDASLGVPGRGEVSRESSQDPLSYKPTLPSPSSAQGPPIVSLPVTVLTQTEWGSWAPVLGRSCRFLMGHWSSLNSSL